MGVAAVRAGCPVAVGPGAGVCCIQSRRELAQLLKAYALGWLTDVWYAVIEPVVSGCRRQERVDAERVIPVFII